MSNAQYYMSNGTLMINDDCQYIMLVKTDAKANNNKFYEMTMDSSCIVTARYGRVGSDGTTTNVGRGFSAMQQKAMEKFRKGYLPVETVTNADSVHANVKKNMLLDCAIKEIIPSKAKKAEKELLSKLINMLVSTNQHQIANFSGGAIQIDDSGLVKTAVGVVSLKSIHEARKTLDKLSNLDVNKNEQEFIDSLNHYLMLIPQKVNHSRGWHLSFFRQHSFAQQYEFLEQLEKSVEMYEDILAQEQKNKSSSNDDNQPKVFNTQLKLVTNKKVINKIKSYFDDNKNAAHGSSKLQLLNVYEIVGLYNDEQLTAFDKLAKEKGNVQEYWHGSRNYNLLSILKNGLIIPKSNSFNVTGRMFGDGVYFSNQSTKSLNYSQGYWDRGRGIDNNCFMFLADVIMGKAYEASHKQAKLDCQNNQKTRVYPVKGYDSVIARGGVKNVTHSGDICSLSNDEMIVFDLGQIKLKYLCEFGFGD